MAYRLTNFRRLATFCVSDVGDVEKITVSVLIDGDRDEQQLQAFGTTLSV